MLNFGFIGFGQYGGRQVDAILKHHSQYTGMAVNTAINDLDGLETVPEGNRMRLKGNSFGAGRTPEIGYEAFLDNGVDFVELAKKVTHNSDYTWVVAGLGGGTGTGALQGLLEHGTELFDQTIGLIVTIPRDDDGREQKRNAMKALGYIQQAIDDKRIGAVIILDNDRFYKQFAEEKRQGDWRDHSNTILAETLHKLNQITVEKGHSNFDRTDLLKLLSCSGCLAVGRAAIHGTDEENVWKVISNSMQKGFFASGYRLEEAQFYALCFTLNQEGESIRQSKYEQYFTSHLKTMLPSAEDSFFGYYSNGENSVLSVVSGLGLPERVFDFESQVEVAVQRNTRKFNVEMAVTSQSSNPLLRQKKSASDNNPLLRTRTARSVENNPLVSKRGFGESVNPLLSPSRNQ